MRIFTDINVSKERGDYHARAILQALFWSKIAALILAINASLSPPLSLLWI